jgi:hypothetical protein
MTKRNAAERRRPHLGVGSGVQLPLDGLPLNPAEVAQLSSPERGALYRDLELSTLQIAAIEEAVRRVIAGTYLRRAA